jgi:RNA polymerase-binding transcription factor DksA
MADEIDVAERLRENELQLALAKHQQNTAMNRKGALFCEECQERMPETRKNAGYRLCIECAKDKERMDALFAK